MKVYIADRKRRNVSYKKIWIEKERIIFIELYYWKNYENSFL